MGKKLPHLKIRKIKDNDLEPIYKTIKCPGDNCDYTATNIVLMREHISDKHDDADMADRELYTTPELVDLETPGLTLEILMRISTNDSKNPLSQIRKMNDSFNTAQLWKYAFQASQNGKTDISLKKTQYEWLHQLLDRKLPQTKEDKENGIEQETVITALYGLSEYQVRRVRIHFVSGGG